MMNFRLIWDSVNAFRDVYWMALKLFFTALPKALYLLIKYYTLLFWYFIFTPKNAEYVDDIPILYKAQTDIEMFMQRYAVEYGLLLSVAKIRNSKK